MAKNEDEKGKVFRNGRNNVDTLISEVPCVEDWSKKLQELFLHSANKNTEAINFITGTQPIGFFEKADQDCV